ncbi:hypothetical protein V9T40_003531 [Parthenolecanium corni]|uniref:Tudor domain-containing protein n=1 Tax=Parthenolecanium corni TaxID=536013 RepID=A0AAN9TRG1_9HEMI
MSDSLDVLEEHLEKVNEDLLENEDDYVIKDAKELVGVKMCLVKYIEDGKWHRGVIQELVPDENEAQVLYVDYGSREAVPFDRIADCQRISSILSEIPPQAILVELVKPTQEIFTERIIDFLLNLASPKTPFMMKVVEDRNVPYVELFLRLDHNEEFHSVNDLIGTCFNEYRGKNFKMITISKELNEKFRPIPAFPLPQPMAEFYVYIYMVSHPHLFFVQPHDFRPKLKELMRVMDEFYSKEAPAVNIDDLTKGQVYAVKCEDNMWYRGTCHQIIESENSISVKLVDYGNIISVKFKDISHLLPCFRELPCLAIKAELAGIAPKNKDWDLRDCIRFKDLVYEKVLISFIADVAEKVSMVLYDTSMGGEVDIGAQLVMEGHAVDITER